MKNKDIKEKIKNLKVTQQCKDILTSNSVKIIAGVMCTVAVLAGLNYALTPADIRNEKNPVIKEQMIKEHNDRFNEKLEEKDQIRAEKLAEQQKEYEEEKAAKEKEKEEKEAKKEQEKNEKYLSANTLKDLQVWKTEDFSGEINYYLVRENFTRGDIYDVLTVKEYESGTLLAGKKFLRDWMESDKEIYEELLQPTLEEFSINYGQLISRKNIRADFIDRYGVKDYYSKDEVNSYIKSLYENNNLALEKASIPKQKTK